MKAEPLTRIARAKINLTLHVTGQREDGYHLLDSLVCFADIGDGLRVEPDSELSLRVEGPFAEGVPTDERNLVLKAARLFETEQGARLVLTKNLPHAAGIGGGSADAAATLLALAEIWDKPVPNNLLSLGADVPVCLSPMALRMRGIGEDLSPIPPLPPLWAVLVNPRVEVETPRVFTALEHKENASMERLPDCADAAEFADWCRMQRNDLQAPAIAIAPRIQAVLEALSDSLLARMSGSGATCFGLCDSEAQASTLAVEIAQNHPDWWVVPTRLS